MSIGPGFKRLIALAFVGCALTLAVAAQAGQVYGTVLEGNAAAKNKAVTVTCQGQSASATTDAYGSYSLYVDASGRCEISVAGSQPISLRVYEDDVRADLRLDSGRLSRR